jgi:hypothetical protein
VTSGPTEPSRDSRKVGFFLVMGAVFWSFFGVRKSADHARISASVKPQHYILAGLLGAALFGCMLFVVVKVVLHFVKPT